MRPFLIVALFISLTLSLVRIETYHLRRSLKRWRWVALLSFWILVLCPVTVWFVLEIFTLPAPIVKAALITAAAPPVTSCAAIAIFLGVDAAIAVVLTLATMLLAPLSLPPIVFFLADLHIVAEISQVSLRLALFIFTAFFFAALIKKWIGESRIYRNGTTLDGISVLFIGVFIIGIMDGVTGIIILRPPYVFLVFMVSTLLVLGLYLTATILFWRLGPCTAMAIGLVSGNCNMGLMYLILADQAQLDLLIFFAVGQIPMYFLPAILAPLIKRLCASDSCSRRGDI
jgi:BASS family bile acid:Na+ symporter